MYTLGVIVVMFLVFIGIPIGLGLLLYFIPKKLGYPKLGKYLAIAFGILIVTTGLYLIFADEFFTKKDAKELVEEQGIKLDDKFSLLNNESSSAIGDYYHIFSLGISAADKQRAIKTIKASKIFKVDSTSIDRSLYMNHDDRYFGPRINQDYETYDAYVREYFLPSGQQGYAPTFRRISISKNENKLTFEDIVE